MSNFFSKVKNQLADPGTRKYIYTIFMATLPLLTSYGFISQNDVALWASVVGSVLGFGLARANTPLAPVSKETRRK